MEDDRRDCSVREVAAVTVGALSLAVAMTWPLVLRLRTHVVQDPGDPLLQAWQVAWGGHALRTPGVELFQANAFWPLPDALAFSDALLGYAPAGLLGTGLTAATVRHGLLVLLACTLAVVGAHLLAREVGARPWAALLAGVIAAWAPWRLNHLGHLNILSSGGIALSVFLLLRGYRRGSWRLVLAGWLVATWQLSIGLGAGLFFAYTLGTLTAAAAGTAAVRWWRAGHPDLPAGLVWATLGGVGVLLVATGLQALPYLRVLEAHPEAVRTPGYLELYSPPLRGLLAAPASSLVWGDVTAPLREGMTWAPEQTRFPGAVALLFGLVGAVTGRARPLVRGVLAAVAVGATVLALGTSLAGGSFTYLPLYEVLPGWEGIRTPGRWSTVATLALALLAALGADRLLDRGRLGRLGVAALVGLAALEGAGATPVVEVPRPSDDAVLAAAPRLHLPSTVTGDQVPMLWSVADGFPPVVNGTSGFEPRFLAELRGDVATFPDAASVARLRELGVRSVVLHPDEAAGTPWEGAAARSVAGLGIDRREVPGAVVYDLAP